MYYTNPSPKWHEDICQNDCVLEKRNYLDCSRTIKYRIWADSDIKEHKMASWASDENRVLWRTNKLSLGPSPSTVSLRSYQAILWLFFGTWQNAYIDSLAFGVKVMKVGKKGQVEAPETPHSHLWPRQYIRNNATMEVLQKLLWPPENYMWEW